MKNIIYLKRVIAIITALILTAAITITDFSSINFSAKAENNVWDGTSANNYAGGSGTATDPYLISNGAQLYKMVSENNTIAKSAGVYFKLTEDIYLNDVVENNIKDIKSPNLWYHTLSGTSYQFAGNFDGNGFTVYGIYINAGNRGGLFPQLAGGSVLNLKISKSFIQSSGRPGAIAGAVWTGNSNNISKCYIDDTVTINGKDSAGGLIGYVNTAYISVSDSATFANITSKTTAIGGLIGGTANNKNCSIEVKNCWTYGYNILYKEKNAVATTNNCYAVSNSSSITGTNAKDNMPELDWENVWQTTEKFPTIKYNSVNPFWDGSVAEKYESGSGTAQDPYLITNAAQLYKMVSENGVNDGTAVKYFKLANSIYINDISDSDWATKGATPWYTAKGSTYYFNDNFDGAGFTVYGLYVIASDTRAGLFPQLSDGAVVSNLRINNAVVKGTKGRSGTIAGTVQPLANKAAVEIKKCSVENTTVTDRYAAGGIIGTFTASCVISDCYFNGTLSCTDKVTGGIAPDGWSASCTIKNCYSIEVYPVSGNNTKNYTISNTYTNIEKASKTSKAVGNITSYVGENKAKMKGEEAKTAFKGFDFNDVWITVAENYPILREPALNKYWNGKAADSYAGGNGTQDDPYKISNAAQLYKMVSENGKNDGAAPLYFILTNDIYINDVSVEDWQDEMPTPWYTTEGTDYYFNDYFEGAGFTVYGLYVKSTTTRAGLFPQLSDGAVVCNLRISDAVISGKSGRSGAVCGAIQPLGEKAAVTLSGCAVEKTTVSDRYAAGGIIGTFTASCVITDCYFNGKLSCTDKVTGGIAPDGWNSSCTIKNCYSIGAYPVSGNNTKSYTLSNVYTNIATASKTAKSVAAITSFTGSDESKIKGKAAKENLKGFDFSKTWAVNESYPVLIKRIGDGTVYDTKKAGEIWSGYPSKGYAGGTGTESDPYLIETGGQLAKLVKESISGSTVGKYYKLIHDIYLNDTSVENWKDTANQWYTTNYFRNCFRGNFDGNGHIVSGMYIYIKRQENTYAGLFPSLGEDGVIKNVGIVNSEILLDGTIEMHAGAITGFINIYEIEKVNEERYPVISQCFGDSTVKIEAKFPGGILASAGRPVIIDNCFFTGDTASYYGNYGSILGYTWMNYGGIKISNCYAAKQSLGTKISEDKFSVAEYINCYSSGPQANEGIERVYINIMRGDTAKNSMNKLDFENVWVTRENQTPGLKIFDTDKYSTTNNSDNVTLSFVTNCNIVVKPMTGVAYTAITLPIPQREGYIFEGWYAYPELDVKYTLSTFPSFSTNLYAKWKLTGIDANFENYPNTEYDLGEDYELYRPSLSGYDAKYVHTGARSIHRMGNTPNESDFLVFYEEELNVGDTYKMTFWVSTDEKSADTEISLIHATWPDVNEPNAGIEKIVTAKGLTDGSWEQYTYTFTAKSKWVSVRTSGGKSIYLDDFFFSKITSGNPVNSDKNTESDAPSPAIPETGSRDYYNSLDTIAVIGVLSAMLCVALRKTLQCENNK